MYSKYMFNISLYKYMLKRVFYLLICKYKKNIQSYVPLLLEMRKVF